MQRRRGSAARHPHPGPRQAPLLDPGVLAELEAEVPGAGARFASAFVNMWDLRWERIDTALHDGQADRAIEAVLSLRVAAVMVGAPRLAAEAAALEALLRSGAAVPGLERIRDCGQRTVSSLRQCCLGQAPAAPAQERAADGPGRDGTGPEPARGQDHGDPDADVIVVPDGCHGPAPAHASHPVPAPLPPAPGRWGPAGPAGTP